MVKSKEFYMFANMLKNAYSNDSEVLNALEEYVKLVENAKTIEEIKKVNKEWYNKFYLDDIANDISIGMMFSAIYEK